MGRIATPVNVGKDAPERKPNS